MLKLGIIGYPLEHTLSPVMHNAALQYLNINGSYKTYEVKENELEKLFCYLRDSGVKGFNVTIPYKTTIIKFLDKLTERAELVQAVNTVTFQGEGKSVGDNTDIVGFWEAIPDNFKKKVPKASVSLIGAGGAAHAVSIALLLNKVDSLKIYARNSEKLSGFEEFLESRKQKLNLKTKIQVDLLKNIDLSEADLLVNTTPVGMFPDIDKSPVTKEELKRLPQGSLIYDLIYNPKQTLLLVTAASLGLNTLSGIEMLIRQGASSLGIWTQQKDAPLGVMRLAVEQSFEHIYS